MPIVVGVAILAKKYSTNLYIAYAGVQGTGILIFSLFKNFNFSGYITDFDVSLGFLFLLLLTVFQLIYSKKNQYPNFYRNLIDFLKWVIIPVILIFAIIIWVAPDIIPLGLSVRFMSILNPFIRDAVSLVASVAEHVPSAWSSFYYNILIPLMLVPLGIYFCFKRGNLKEIVLILLLLTLFYFTGSMVRIILIFAPIASLVAAYGLTNVLNIYGSFAGERKTGVSRKRRRQVKSTITNSEIATVYLIVGLVCIAQVAHAVDASVDQLSHGSIVTGGVFHDWEESLSWMRNNLDGTTVVASWWDYGYWLTPIGNVTTINDNNTLNHTRIGATGMALMQTDEIYSAKIFKNLGAEYVLVFFSYLVQNLGGDEGKWQWMLRICNDNYEQYKSFGWEEDNWADGAVFDESEYTTESGVKGDKWFDSQLAKLMFWGVPTKDPNDPSYSSTIGEGSLPDYYNQRIYSWKDQDGKLWKEHIPDNGAYQSDVFIPAHFSIPGGLVKLFRIDYTVLESSFTIKDTNAYESGYSTFKLENTGTKDLTIKNVSIAGKNYDFAMGKGIGTNQLQAGDDDLVWVDFGSSEFEEDDIVSISVIAEAEGLSKNKIDISETSDDFLVTVVADEGEIKINEKNSWVEQVSSDTVNIYLEVENTGTTIITIANIYANSKVSSLSGNYNPEYLQGSSIISPGSIAKIKIAGVDDYFVDFSPIGEKSNMIGVSTPNGIKDEVLFSADKTGYNLTIYNNSRIISPEYSILTAKSYRYHIPVELDTGTGTNAITYDNGTTELIIKVKNTGTNQAYFKNVFLTTSDTWSLIDLCDYTTSGDWDLSVGEEETIYVSIDEDDYDGLNIDVNDELGIRVTSFGDTILDGSDVGYIHTVKNDTDIQIIEIGSSTFQIGSPVTLSQVWPSGTVQLLVKNTGNDIVKINNTNLLVNGTVATDIEYIYGNETLGIQECAIIQFNYSDTLNSSAYLEIEVNTYTSALDTIILPVNYNVQINETYSSAVNDGGLNIVIDNPGLFNVTIDEFFINGTSIDLNNFSVNFEIENLGGQVNLTLSLLDELLDWNLGFIADDLVAGKKLEIYIRTQEYAEDTYIITIQ